MVPLILVVEERLVLKFAGSLPTVAWIIERPRGEPYLPRYGLYDLPLGLPWAIHHCL